MEQERLEYIRHEDVKRACRNPLKSIHEDTYRNPDWFAKSKFPKTMSNEKKRNSAIITTTAIPVVVVVFVKTMQTIAKKSNKIPKSNNT